VGHLRVPPYPRFRSQLNKTSRSPLQLSKPARLRGKMPCARPGSATVLQQTQKIAMAALLSFSVGVTCLASAALADTDLADWEHTIAEPGITTAVDASADTHPVADAPEAPLPDMPRTMPPPAPNDDKLKVPPAPRPDLPPTTPPGVPSEPQQPTPRTPSEPPGDGTSPDQPFPSFPPPPLPRWPPEFLLRDGFRMPGDMEGDAAGPQYRFASQTGMQLPRSAPPRIRIVPVTPDQARQAAQLWQMPDAEHLSQVRASSIAESSFQASPLPPDFQFPELAPVEPVQCAEHKLSSGLRTYIVEDREAQLNSGVLLFPGGSFSSPSDQVRRSHAAFVKLCTCTYTSQSMTETAARWATGQVSAGRPGGHCLQPAGQRRHADCRLRAAVRAA
jgi:hypothetical protein